MVHAATIPGLHPSYIDKNIPLICPACADCKDETSTSRTTHSHHPQADTISGDTLGPIRLRCQLHHRHARTFVDATTRYAIFIPICSRTELTTLIPATLTKIAKFHRRPPNRLHVDNGAEYHAHTVSQFISTNGLQPTFTTAYQPQGNSLAERFNRSIMEAVRYAMRHARYLIRSGTARFEMKPKNTTGYFTRRALSHHWLLGIQTTHQPPPFFPSAPLGWVHIPPFKANNNQAPCNRPSRYLYPLNHNIIAVLLTYSLTRAT